MKNNIGIKISFITVIINLLLFVFKLVAGIIGHSNAMVSDAIHSFSDVLTTFLVIFGLYASSKKADRNHPYGHDRIESVCGIVLSFVLFLTGLGIGMSGINNLIHQNNLVMPSILPLSAALISIIVKEGMFHYTNYYAKMLNSTSLKADAWHHRSDAISSIGSFIGILVSRLGILIFDPLCSVLICALIIKSAFSIFMEAVNQILDTSCDEELYNKILNVILKNNKKIKIKELKTRMFGSKLYIDLEIALDGRITLDKANKISNKIHDAVEKEFQMVKHCNIHVVPND